MKYYVIVYRTMGEFSEQNRKRTALVKAFNLEDAVSGFKKAIKESGFRLVSLGAWEADEVIDIEA